MIQVEFSPKAEEDLERIADFIAEDNPRRAFSFVQELRTRCRKLGEFPESSSPFPMLGKNARYAPFGRYIILYNAFNERVRIERILHGARDILAVISEGKSWGAF